MGDEDRGNRHSGGWDTGIAARNTEVFNMGRMLRSQIAAGEKKGKSEEHDPRAIGRLLQEVVKLTGLSEDTLTILLTTKKGCLDIVRFVNYVYEVWDLSQNHPNAHDIDIQAITPTGFLIEVRDRDREANDRKKKERNAQKETARKEVRAFVLNEGIMPSFLKAMRRPRT